MNRGFSLAVYLFGIIMTGMFLAGCTPSSTFTVTELNKNYKFQDKNIITVYVDSPGNENLEDIYARVMCLDLQSRGYKVINANKELKAHNDSISWTGHRQTADSLLNKKYLPLSDIIVMVNTKWDSIPFVTKISEESTVWGTWVSTRQLTVGKLTTQVAYYDRMLREPVMSFSAVDTTHLMIEKEGKDIYYPEFHWMVIARQLTSNTESIPICNNDNIPLAIHKFKVSFLVDKSYRNVFSQNWADQLRLRVVYANDILRTQLGIELAITEIKAWDSEFSNSLESTLAKLHRIYNPNPDVIRIGITLDKKLKAIRSDRAYLGLAYPLQTDAIISAQPTFPGLRLWGPLEEAITLAHEVGHLFGAVHVTNANSVMYPSSSTLAYEFDDVNLKIINYMKNDFMKADKEQLMKDYSKELIEIKNESAKNTFPVLAAIAAGFTNLFMGDVQFENPEKLSASLFKIIPDSVYSLAAAGCIRYRQNYLADATKFLTRAVELNPEFAEAQWYLGSTLKKLGNNQAADLHSELAKPYVKFWVIDK
jgi:tetratricopeptide (TPR) repeat protein